MFVPFETLPDNSRIWIYQSDRQLNSREETIISDTLSAFTSQWKAHGVPLRSSFSICFSQFLILSADEDSNEASGCSIDDSTREIKDLGQQLNIDFFNRALIAFKIKDQIITIPLAELKNKHKEGVWSAQTLLVNTLVSTKGDLKTKWLVLAESTWLKRYLPRETVTG